jgi:hypothetical protein
MQRALTASVCLLFGWASPCSAEQTAVAAAALVSTISAVATSAIQAGADKEIAKINASARKDMTDTVAANSLALAGIQSRTTMYQTYMSALANQISQAAATTQLAMQLATLERLSMLTMNMKQMQFQAEFSLKKASLDLQERMMGAQSLLSRAQQNLLSTQAGFTAQGPAMNSGATLTVAQTGVAVSAEPTVSDATRALSLLSTRARPQAPNGDGANFNRPPLPARSPASQLGAPRAIRSINAYAGSRSAGDAVAVPYR